MNVSSVPSIFLKMRGFEEGCGLPVETRIYDAEMDKTTDLAEIDGHENELKKLKSQFGWLQVTRVKLLMDLIFVCGSCVSISPYSDSQSNGYPFSL